MRCAQFTRSMRKTSSSSSSPVATETAAAHQPQVAPAGAAAAAASKSSSSGGAVRRSSRECKPPQTLVGPSQGISTTMSSTQQAKASTRSSLAALSRSQQPSASLGTATNTSSGKPAQTHARTGGRHPHPPTGNNAKLKHKCPFDGCPWRFATPYKLRRHIKSHTKETPYLCKECGRGFSVRYNLLMHIQTIHSQPQKFKCPIRGCKDAFHSQSRLNGHLRRIHKKDWKTLQASEMKASAVESGSAGTADSASVAPPTASQSSTTGAAAGKMSANRKAKHECPTCGKEYPTTGKLNAHMRTHNTEKPHKCTVQGCDKAFATKEKLSRHTDTHKNTKQFCCPHKNCNRVFLRQSHLKNHLKIHTQDHQFVCPVLDCSQKFSSESEYNVHLNSHINYGYKCPHPNCDLSFPSRKRLAFHARAVHNVTSPTPDSGCTSPLLDGLQPHLGLPPTHALPLHTFTPSPTPSSAPSSSSTKPHLLRYVNKEIIKDVDLPGLSVEDIEAVLSENEDWSGEQMDQFLRSAIDLSDIEAKVLSGGYESDSGYSTYDVSPITSAAPTQLTFATSSQLPGLQGPHGHHVEQSLFTCNLSPTATMFPGGPLGHAPQPPTSLLHDAIHSPCSSDVGFFSPHSGFSSHATTPSHQDALSFFPPHGGPCPIFASYSQPQDFNSLNMSTCFPDGSIPNSDSTIPPFSSQIPDILLPDASLAPPSHPPPLSMPDPAASNVTATAAKFPKSEPVHTACKVQAPPPQQMTKPVAMEVSNLSKQNAESAAAEIKIESHPNSCVFATQTRTESASLSEHAGGLKKEQGVEQETQTTSTKQAAAPAAKSSSKSSNSPSSQAILSKLLGQNGGTPAATILSITAINNNGTTTKLDLSQLQALVGQPNSNSNTKTKSAKSATTTSTQRRQSGSVSDSEATSSTAASSSKSKSGGTPGPKSVPMKATQRKKGQWPRSMSKANLMAFREHILNKLKKGQENSNGGSGSCDGGQKETVASSVVELMKCETPSPSSRCGEVEVTYERNRSAESRCHSEPAEMFGGGPTSSPSTAAALQSSHSESYLHDSTATTAQQGFGGSTDVDTKLADFFPQNCNDVFNLFQFNPDALLSTAIDDQMLDGIDLVWSDEDSCKVDSEIAQFLDSEIHGAPSGSPMELGVQYDIMRDHSPVTNSSPHTSPLVSPTNYNSQPSSPQKIVTPSCSYASVSPTDTARNYHSERALVTGHVTSGPMGAMQMGMFNFPDMLVATSDANEMGGASIEKLHIQQNLLQAHHDPLLNGSSTLLQACGPEAFEF